MRIGRPTVALPYALKLTLMNLRLVQDRELKNSTTDNCNILTLERLLGEPDTVLSTLFPFPDLGLMTPL